MRATVVAQVVALRLRTNNTAAVVRPRLENRLSSVSLSFAGSPDPAWLPRRLPLLVAPVRGIQLRRGTSLRPGGTCYSPPEIVESLKMATRERRVAAFVALASLPRLLGNGRRKVDW